MPVEFEHLHAAHCESGALTALLRHEGLRLSEALVFGIGSGLYFLYFPLVKLYGAPLVAYRDMPNAIIRRASRRLGFRVARRTFRAPIDAKRALDDELERGRPVGLQTGVFWLPYFPRDMRFQFNGHHVVAYARDGDDYLLSDTVFATVVRCPAEDLERARFAQGMLAPRGLLYTIELTNRTPDLARAVRAGLATTSARMLGPPIPYLGVRGMRTLANALVRWPDKIGAASTRAWIASIIRMQEEIGTGGGGFRFMYAAFLSEAAALLAEPRLEPLAAELSVVGDRWREFAVAGAQGVAV